MESNIVTLTANKAPNDQTQNENETREDHGSDQRNRYEQADGAHPDSRPAS